jgi:hypothetical protein
LSLKLLADEVVLDGPLSNGSACRTVGCASTAAVWLVAIAL